MSSPILITGVPRSGTSLVAGLIELGGVHFGRTVPGNRNNPKGFFENSEIRNQIIKPYLASMGCDPMGQDPLPRCWKKIPDLERKVTTILAPLKGERWAYKEPKLLLMWESWLHSFPAAKWVIVRRHEGDILSSVIRTNFMRRWESEEGWRPWLDYHLAEIEDLKKDADHLEIWPSQLLAGENNPLEDLEEFLSIRIPRDAAQSFMEPKLWRGGKK